MKKFILRFLLFLLPLGAGVVYLLANEMPHEYAFNEVQKDIRTGNWFYNRIYQSDAPVDLAFVGSSKTLCNVHDALIQHHLTTRYHIDIQVANCGMNWFGNNLQWVLMRDIIQHKQPRYMVIEVGFDMKAESHRLFPLLAHTADILDAPLINPSYVPDIGKAVWNRWLYQHEDLLNIVHQYDSIPTDSLHSSLMWWATLPITAEALARDSVAEPAILQRALERGSTRTAALPQNFPMTWGYALEKWAPKAYYQQMAELCRQHNIHLIFLYLPTYGIQQSSPRDAEFYQTLGELWLPPDSVFRNPHNYFDPDHLNQNGAVQLADWLSERLAERMGQDTVAAHRADS